MKKKTFNSLLVGAGFLAGTVGVKALTSKTARKCYVQGVAKGLQVKQGYQNIVEEAKSQVDDIVAEANYINLSESEKAEAAKDEQLRCCSMRFPGGSVFGSTVACPKRTLMRSSRS